MECCLSFLSIEIALLVSMFILLALSSLSFSLVSLTLLVPLVISFVASFLSFSPSCIKSNNISFLEMQETMTFAPMNKYQRKEVDPLLSFLWSLLYSLFPSLIFSSSSLLSLTIYLSFRESMCSLCRVTFLTKRE